MATKKRHPNKSTFKDNGITAYTATGPGFIEEASVNVHPDDEDAAIELFEELGYSINSTQTLEDTVNGEEFVRIVAAGAMGVVERAEW
jgi:hypothetical protein